MVSAVMIRNIPKCQGVKSIPSTHMYLKNNFVCILSDLYLCNHNEFHNFKETRNIFQKSNLTVDLS